MSHRLGSLITFTGLAIAGLVAIAAQPALRARTAAPVTVHEWGTFTSVAGADGQAVAWQPLSGQSDLPCFVRMLNPQCIKCLRGTGIPHVVATVRMETPVLYFYADEQAQLDVHVRFPQGLITEWYPQAEVPATFVGMFDPRFTTGSIAWRQVSVSPGREASFPREPGDSHYYAARETDAAPVGVAGQHEKFLFYRGLASFQVPLDASVDGRGIAVEPNGPRTVVRGVLFHNERGRVGYRLVDGLDTPATIPMPDPAQDLGSLRRELVAMLVDEGLYRREAEAMVATWRDSWFEEGTRLFYLLPGPAVDRILPLSITPAPVSVVRAFVGRIEIATPETLAEIERALVASDIRTLSRYGRFLDPFAAQVMSRPSLAGRTAQVENALRLVAQGATPEATCPNRASETR